MKGLVYQPLTVYLSTCQADEVRLSFADLERILGQPLPPIAYTATWWANTYTKPPGRTWLTAGWRADARGIRARIVTFTRQRSDSS